MGRCLFVIRVFNSVPSICVERWAKLTAGGGTGAVDPSSAYEKLQDRSKIKRKALQKGIEEVLIANRGVLSNIYTVFLPKKSEKRIRGLRLNHARTWFLPWWRLKLLH